MDENEQEVTTQINVDEVTKRTDEEINLSVGNDSKKQEREGIRNDKSYNVLEEKSDYNIYNPALIEDISFSIPVTPGDGGIYTIKLGSFYPITITTNSGVSSDPNANTPQAAYISFSSNDMTKAYVKDGILYAVGATEGNNTVTISGIFYTKNAEGKEISITSSFGIKIS